MVEEGRKRAEEEHRRWKAELEEAERRREQELRVEALKQSRDQLFAVIEAWGTVTRLEGFFADAERRVSGVSEDARVALLERLDRARQVIGSVDALRHFQAWKTPEEMFEVLTEKARRPW
jgi:hypothetical protein